MTPTPVSPLWVVIGSSLWMAVVSNFALWRQLHSIQSLTAFDIGVTAAVMIIAITAALTALLALTAWRATLKPATTILLLMAAVGSYFMLSYRIVIDPGMMTNFLQTDVREAGALLNWRLAVAVALLAIGPVWLIWRQPILYESLGRQLWRNPAIAMAALAILVVSLMGSFQTLAPLMRNHKELRYLVNPLNSLYAIGRVAEQPLRRDSSVLSRVAEDARLAANANDHEHPPLMLLIVGETARSDNFGLNGYNRNTTPQLQNEDVASFRNVWACGTSTATALPCMFSSLDRDKYADRRTESEGLLDVLQRAGYAVLWLDNQSGCKGACNRIPSASVCPTDDCLDETLLDDLDARLAAMPRERRALGTLIVMHQMGSHGPAYHLRSPPTFKHFLPECQSSALQSCTREEVVNAYDNSIVYTDHFLSRAITWLKGHKQTADTALIYVSDHGESLGEGNLYLHGMPYSLAPDVQKRVPWITWLSPEWQKATGLSIRCLKEAAGAEVSHDHYFHSILGLMNVETDAYVPTLDAYARCRNPERLVPPVDAKRESPPARWHATTARTMTRPNQQPAARPATQPRTARRWPQRLWPKKGTCASRATHPSMAPLGSRIHTHVICPDVDAVPGRPDQHLADADPWRCHGNVSHETRQILGLQHPGQVLGRWRNGPLRKHGRRHLARHHQRRADSVTPLFAVD